MRVLARRTLRVFWESCPANADAETPLTEWYHHMEQANYHTPQELKAVLRNASIVKGGRVVFNIHGNKYRVVVSIRYDWQMVYVKFVGTHAEYDKIDVETV